MKDEKVFAKEKLINTYIDLLRTKQYDKITITSVVEKAGVNRSTFYRNFQDIFDIYYQSGEYVVLQCLNAYKPQFAISTRTDLSRFADELVERLVYNCPKLDFFIGENGNLKILDNVCQIYRNYLLDFASKNGFVSKEDKTMVYFQTDYMIGTFVLKRLNCDYFDTWFDQKLFEKLNFKYNHNRSFLQNIVDAVPQLVGGSNKFHSSIIQSAAKLMSRGVQYDEISITKMLKIAGISRTEFYNYFDNYDGFIKVLVTIASYLECQLALEALESDGKRIEELANEYIQFLLPLEKILGLEESTMDVRVAIYYISLGQIRGIIQKRAIEKHSEAFLEKYDAIIGHFVCAFMGYLNYYVATDSFNDIMKIKILYNMRKLMNL